MNINPINKNQNTNNSFGKLNKVTCRYNSSTEQRVKLELENLAHRNDFFKENDVNAQIWIQRNFAELSLKYKPAAKNFFNRIKNLFVDETEIKLTKYRLCPDEGMFFLAKELRNANTSEDLLNLAKKAQ